MAATGNFIIISKKVGNDWVQIAATKSHSLNVQVDMIEKASSTQQSWKEYVAGRKEWSVNVSYLVMEDANNNVRDVLSVGDNIQLKISDRNGSYSVTGYAIMTTCKQDYSIGNLCIGSFAFQGTGALT